jgi:secreted trypsin-like serine protease
MSKMRFLITALASATLLCSCGGDVKVRSESNNSGTQDSGAGASIITGTSNSGSSSISGNAGRIINGVAVDPLLSPQVAEIKVTNSDGSEGICSGVAVGPGEILTAAHCFAGLTPLASGSDELTTTVTIPLPAGVSLLIGGQVLPATEVTIPAGYRFDAQHGAIFNDIAIVHTYALNVPPLPIVTSRPVTTGEALLTFGFGLDENGDYGVLKAGEVLVETVTANHIFSAPFDGSNVDPCNGDSGGPGVLNFTSESGESVYGVAGLVSSGTVPDCSKGDVTLFTNLQNPGLEELVRSQVPEAIIF